MYAIIKFPIGLDSEIENIFFLNNILGETIVFETIEEAKEFANERIDSEDLRVISIEEVGA